MLTIFFTFFFLFLEFFTHIYINMYNDRINKIWLSNSLENNILEYLQNGEKWCFDILDWMCTFELIKVAKKNSRIYD
jgi:hypothetical protein